MKNRNRPTSKRPFEGPGRAAAAVVLLAALASGCMRPLALQDEYFSSASRSIATTNAETLRTVRHHRALQAAQHACPRPVRPAAAPAGPDLGSPPARAALAGTCASTVAKSRPVSAHGSTSNAHRRWEEDQVRELPDPTESAASIGDG